MQRDVRVKAKQPQQEGGANAEKRCDRPVALRHGARIKAPQQPEDLELIHRSQAGDAEAFSKLVTNYWAKILARLRGMVRNEYDARDLAQEGFLKAWHSIRQFEGRSSFSTWLSASR